jgi:hypothetical protein
MLIFFLLGAAIFASAVPRIDAPETSFDEADAPIIVAPAERPSIQLVSPTLDRIAHSPVLCAPGLRAQVAESFSADRYQLALVSSSLHRPSLQNFLCTLLI